jgi:hypothetical protein
MASMDSKSYAEYALGVLAAQLVDCATYYPGLRKEFDRDLIRLSSAIEHHGLRFVTETMPAYRKHFDQCLDARRLTPFHSFHFGTYEKGGTIPRLFRGLILRVFDGSSELRQDADKQAVQLLRQLLGVCRKLRVDCGTKNRCEAVLEFVQIDDECTESSLVWDDAEKPLSYQVPTSPELSFQDEEGIRYDAAKATVTPTQASTILWHIQRAADYLTGAMGLFDPYEWRPKHGPGAVSDQRFGVDKYDFKRWSRRLDTIFPYADFALSSYAQLPEDVANGGIHYSDEELVAKMACVPKTTKTPRLIACEPVAGQWCQQIIRDYFYSRVRDSAIRKFISFDDQAHNATMALEASSSLSHWTIDLSSASDRISCWHVERLFRRNLTLLDALWATRSVELRQDIAGRERRRIHLRKYSTMGNATTFPVQSVFFLSVALGCISWRRGVSIASLVRRANGREVRIFGDDMVVPVDSAPVVVEMLQYLKLKVNAAKTFGGTAFRESCGVDAFLGQDVTSISILDAPEHTRPGSVVSSVDVHNNQLNAGFVATAAYIRKTVERTGMKQILNVAAGSGRFGWQTFDVADNSHLKSRWNNLLQRREVRSLTTHVVEPRTPPNTPAGYLRYFTEAPKVVTSAISSLGFATSRPRTKLRLRWVPC